MSAGIFALFPVLVASARMILLLRFTTNLTITLTKHRWHADLGCLGLDFFMRKTPKIYIHCSRRAGNKSLSYPRTGPPLMVRYASRSDVYGDGRALHLLVCRGLPSQASVRFISRIFRGDSAIFRGILLREAVG